MGMEGTGLGIIPRFYVEGWPLSDRNLVSLPLSHTHSWVARTHIPRSDKEHGSLLKKKTAALVAIATV